MLFVVVVIIISNINWWVFLSFSLSLQPYPSSPRYSDWRRLWTSDIFWIKWRGSRCWRRICNWRILNVFVICIFFFGFQCFCCSTTIKQKKNHWHWKLSDLFHISNPFTYLSVPHSKSYFDWTVTVGQHVGTNFKNFCIFIF